MLKRPWAARWRRGEEDPLGRALGTLEREVMEVVWQQGRGCTVRDVHQSLGGRVAYTTVMTTLDRLFKKGFVTRTRSGRAFVYMGAQTREQLEAAVAGGVVSGLLSNSPGAALPILSHLVDTMSAHESGLDLLDMLENLVRDTRRRLKEDREEEA